MLGSGWLFLISLNNYRESNDRAATVWKVNEDDFSVISMTALSDGTDLMTLMNLQVDKLTFGTTKVARFWVNETYHDLTDTSHDAQLHCVAK